MNTKNSNHSLDLPLKAEQKGNEEPEQHHFILSRREAKAASPEDMAVCGEEDPGEALEFLITEEDNQAK